MQKTVQLNEFQKELCQQDEWDFSSISALFLNCTLKKSPRLSHTSGLINMSKTIMTENGIKVDDLRPVDYQIANGVYPDMKEYGWTTDEWPTIWEKVIASDILVLTSPIWLGEKSSVATKVIERLYGQSGSLNDKGQYIYYGKVGVA